jgi:hypothetical protein
MFHILILNIFVLHVAIFLLLLNIKYKNQVCKFTFNNFSIVVNL